MSRPTRLNKRGITQVDWAISLAIFLLYLIWFFVFTRPMYEPQQKLDPLADIIHEKFIENTTWTFKNIPMIIESNYSKSATPIFFTMPNGYEERYIHMDGRFFYFENSTNRIIFLSDLIDQRSLIDLKYTEWPTINHISDKRKPATLLDVQSGSTSITNMNTRIFFSNGMLNRIRFGLIDYLKAPITISERTQGVGSYKEITNYTYQLTETPIFAKYELNASLANISSYVFTNNSGVVSQFKFKNINPGTTKEFKLVFRTRNFSSYYLDSNKNGMLSYDYDDCQSSTSRIIDFFDTSGSGIAFIADREADISFCTGDKEINITVEFETTDDFEYRFMIHPAPYTNVLNQLDFHVTSTGFISDIDGISPEILADFNSTGYKDYKLNWSYPRNRDFQLEMWNQTNLAFLYSPDAYSEQIDIFTKTYYLTFLDIYGEEAYAKLYVRVW